ncbi:MAG: hypothetical protein IPQ13_07890 [Holophagaceae bacterium]|nr:hypothetical protein [Holophagaceae bacterium]
MSSGDKSDNEVQAKKEELSRLLNDLARDQRSTGTEADPSNAATTELHQTIHVVGANPKVAGRDYYELGPQIARIGKDNPNAIICPQCHQITGRQSPECRGSVNCGFPIKKQFDEMDQHIKDLETAYILRFAGVILAPIGLSMLLQGIPTPWLIYFMLSAVLAYRGYEKYQACEKAKEARSKFIPA